MVILFIEVCFIHNASNKLKGQLIMYNPEKLATFGYTRKNPLCVGHHYVQATTNNVNKT